MNTLTVVEYQGSRVLTTAQLAEVYETETKNIQMNFSRNTSRFVEGKDYYVLQGAELKAFKGNTTISGFASNLNKLILWTDRGANRHSKILDTDNAWQQFDVLEETYFKAKNNLLPDFGNPVIAARAWADATEAKYIAEAKVLTLTPKAEYFDKLVDHSLLLNIRDTAKELGIKEKKFVQWLLDESYVYRSKVSGKLKPYAEYNGTLFQLKEFATGDFAGNSMMITVDGRKKFMEECGI